MHHRLCFIALLFLFFGMNSFAGEKAADDWLLLGPLSVYQPVFADSAQTTDDLLSFDHLDKYDLWPRAKDTVPWYPAGQTQWRHRTGESVAFQATSELEFAYALSYLRTDRYQKFDLKVTSSRPLALFAGEENLGTATSKGEDSLYALDAKFAAHSGKHCLLVKSVDDAESEGEWTLTLSVDIADSLVSSVAWSSDPRRGPAHYKEYARVTRLTHPRISPNGQWIAVLRSTRDREYKKQTWIEVFEAANGKPVQTIRMTKPVANLQFLPKGRRISFTTSNDEGVTLWTHDLATSDQQAIIKDVKGLGQVRFSPDERLLYYSVAEDEDETETGYKLYQELADRVPSSDDLKIYVRSLADGMTIALTEPGEYSLDGWELSPDGKQLLLLRGVPKQGRPYTTFEFWVHDLESHTSELVDSHDNIEVPSSFAWLPGNRIAYAMGSHDAAPSDTVFHNASNLGLYVLDIDKQQSRKLTEDEPFSVADERGHRRVFWNPKDKKIWFHAFRGGERVVLKVSPDGNRFEEAIRTDFDFVDVPHLSADGSVITYAASGTRKPSALYAQKTRGGAEKLIVNPNREFAHDFIFGEMTKQDFVNSSGNRIDGWLYHPADFAPDKSWPLIVYYYGGVSPRDLRFTFTYQWWLANGYCVYVLNPVGAYGYGQEFADLHANDWGTLATQDVIEGTQILLDEKNFLDRERVGAYGGSYGGFITLDLVTKTDLFAAAVDMYGISNIASYFGGGTWGYWYSDLASPGSFPWSDRDIYVEKSPVFHADKVSTPLLILHGGSDINVPPIESDQMFVALKLLGRDVVYAKFDGESHNINRKFKNLIEHREMMLEWFDKYLKGRSGAWEERLED